MIRSAMSVTKRTPKAAKGMVVAEHPLGAEVGAGILARGGNAVDAAVATAFAMPVVEPFMSTIAGGGSFLVHRARTGETIAIDANVEAPGACHETCYALTEGQGVGLFTWRRVVDDANMHGPRSVAVPGSVAGLCLALERYGTMDLADVLAPAIALAENGFVPDWYVALTMATYCREIAAFPETARTYLRDGHYVLRPPGMADAAIDGDRLRQPDLAQSLRLIAKEGPAAFYRGAIAEAIDGEMRRTGGFLTRDDLAGYAPRVLSPLRGQYREVDLAFVPGATGGITALQMLNTLAQFPSARVTYRTPAGLHLRAEAVRRAFEDRFRYLGDALRTAAPWSGLASPDYAAALARTIQPGGPRSAAAPPDPWAYEAGAPSRGRRRGGVAQATATGDCTTHVCAVDAQRNMVSFTNTAVSLFGSRMVVPGTGILLQNGMIWFDPEPGRPNSVAAGKRPLVNMVPVLGFRRGQPAFTLGAPGGRKIVSTVPQVVSNMLDAGDAPQAAVEAPRLHCEGGDLWVDDRVGDRHLAALGKMGHPVVPRHVELNAFYFARPIAIRIDRRGLEAGLDPLCDASAAGV